MVNLRSVRTRPGALAVLAVPAVSAVLAAAAVGCAPESPTIPPSAASVIDTVVHQRCPARDPGHATNLPWFGGKLVVVAHPTVLVACGYPGLQQPGTAPRAVARRVLTDRAAVASWRDRLNALPPIRAGVFNCGPDNGSAALMAFLRGHDVTVVRVHRSGCASASNGQVVRGTPLPVLVRLARLVS